MYITNSVSIFIINKSIFVVLKTCLRPPSLQRLKEHDDVPDVSLLCRPAGARWPSSRPRSRNVSVLKVGWSWIKKIAEKVARKTIGKSIPGYASGLWITIKRKRKNQGMTLVKTAVLENHGVTQVLTNIKRVHANSHWKLTMCNFVIR